MPQIEIIQIPISNFLVKENNMLSDKQIQDIKDSIDISVTKFLSNLPQKVDRMLSDSVLQTLGLRHDGFRTKCEIDHCNGNKRVLHDMINETTMATVRSRLSKIIVNTLDELPVEAHQAIEQEAIRTYTKTFRKVLHQTIVKQAEDDANSFVQSLNARNFNFGPASIDPCDPDSFDGVLGEAFMNSFVRKLHNINR
jgi:hypothetical protein